ncbi:MAG TPA: N-acetylmuramoyl-L-alanine amidase, partial [Kofleriaceae bacterium]|nr:N-acetylmuramoyl-L-alanine amidase [Kofleriaceae bacterium]
RQRPPGEWIRQIIVHTTWGGWPHVIVPGAGPRGGAKITADYWHTSPDGKRQSGGAHLVVDEDGSIACLADVVRVEAYHATWSNPWSVGIEMFQWPSGRIREATLDATVALVRALCEQLAIPFQIPARAYPGAPIVRMSRGGADMAGVFGHRDNTAERGRGDPGDEIWRRLELAGAEPLDFDAHEDLVVWRRRQHRLNELAVQCGLIERVAADGLAGPATLSALRRHGFSSGRGLDEFDAAAPP